MMPACARDRYWVVPTVTDSDEVGLRRFGDTTAVVGGQDGRRAQPAAGRGERRPDCLYRGAAAPAC